MRTAARGTDWVCVCFLSEYAYILLNFYLLLQVTCQKIALVETNTWPYVTHFTLFFKRHTKQLGNIHTGT